jgi:hypothetical protein
MQSGFSPSNRVLHFSRLLREVGILDRVRQTLLSVAVDFDRVERTLLSAAFDLACALDREGHGVPAVPKPSTESFRLQPLREPVSEGCADIYDV